MVGKTIGSYQLVEHIGSGGMADVYRARDLRLHQSVALKLIRPERVRDQNALKRFDREAHTLAQLVHPNIVRIIDYGMMGDRPYLVMDHLSGGTLKRRMGLAHTGPEAARLLVPVAQALAYAHAQGVLHRDVKPANILLSEDGIPMLSDFGIAKILLESESMDSLTETGRGLGTPEYTAPEQWTGQGDARSDVYALGVVFYELTTGRRPYQADTPAGILIKQATEPVPHPRELAPQLTEADEYVVLKALARDPVDRYPTMAAFARDLERITVQAAIREAQLPPTLSDPPLRTTSRGLAPRNWRVGAAIATTAVLLTGAGGWLAFEYPSQAATQAAAARATSAISLTRTALNQLRPPCAQPLIYPRIWQGDLGQACLIDAHGTDTVALEISAQDWSIVEVDSGLVPVEAGRIYDVSYWVRTEIEVNGAELYGRVLAAQFSAQAVESQSITENRLDAGFSTGASIGGSSGWTWQTYSFTALPEAAYVRLRGVLGGPIGTARGQMWLTEIHLTAR